MLHLCIKLYGQLTDDEASGLALYIRTGDPADDPFGGQKPGTAPIPELDLPEDEEELADYAQREEENLSTAELACVLSRIEQKEKAAEAWIIPEEEEDVFRGRNGIYEQPEDKSEDPVFVEFQSFLEQKDYAAIVKKVIEIKQEKDEDKLSASSRFFTVLGGKDKDGNLTAENLEHIRGLIRATSELYTDLQIRIFREKEAMEERIRKGEIPATQKLRDEPEKVRLMADALVDTMSRDAGISYSYNEWRGDLATIIGDTRVDGKDGSEWLVETQNEMTNACYRERKDIDPGKIGQIQERAEVKGHRKAAEDLGYIINEQDMDSGKPLFVKIPEAEMTERGLMDMDKVRTKQGGDLGQYNVKLKETVEEAKKKLSALRKMVPKLWTHNNTDSYTNMENALIAVTELDGSKRPAFIKKALETLKTQAQNYEREHSGRFVATKGYGADRKDMSVTLQQFAQQTLASLERFGKTVDTKYSVDRQINIVRSDLEKIDNEKAKRKKEQQDKQRRKLEQPEIREMLGTGERKGSVRKKSDIQAGKASEQKRPVVKTGKGP